MRISSLIAAAMIAATLGAPAAIAQTDTPAAASSVASLPSGDFVRKSKRIKGGWSVVERDGNTYIRFADDFRAAGGPDLKVFLSPISVADVTGDTAVDGSINIGELQKTKGAQEYLVPAGVNLDDFESVLVHCEAYSILWGGGDL